MLDAGAKLLRNFLDLLLLSIPLDLLGLPALQRLGFGFHILEGRDYGFESVHHLNVWLVEFWKCDWEIKHLDQLGPLALQGVSQLDEILVHDEGLGSLLGVKRREALKQFCDVVVIEAVVIYLILKKHEYYI